MSTKDIHRDIKVRLEPEAVFRHFGVAYSPLGRGQFEIRCPSPGHEDKNPSCHVKRDPPGTWKCHSCGATGSVIDLWCLYSGAKLSARTTREMADAAGLDVDRYDDVEDVAADAVPEVVAEHIYADAGGRVRFTIQRVEPGRWAWKDREGKKHATKDRPKDAQVSAWLKRKRKEFFPRYMGDDKSPLLYRLPQVTDAIAQEQTIFLVEGEKTADQVAGLGLCSTTWPGGTGKAQQALTQCGKALRGAKVVAFPDNDKVGIAAMKTAVGVLRGFGVEAQIAMVPGLLSGQDAGDAIEAGATREDVEGWAKLAQEIEEEDWASALSRTGYGEVKGHLGNAALILEHAPEMEGVLRYNEVGAVIEVTRRPPWKTAPSAYPRTYRDSDDAALCQWLANKADPDLRVAVSETVAGSAARLVASFNRVDPIRDYLEGLEWDGIKRVETLAHSHFGAVSSEESKVGERCLFDIVLARWLTGAARRAITPGTKFDTILVLEGLQGDRKSTALAVLGGAHYTDQVRDINSKDTGLLLAQTWILEIGELDALNKKEVTEVKTWASANVDSFRPPYGRAIVDCPRRVAVAATTNETTYLKDATGDRRFWPLPCARVDDRRLREDRDQIWAEAKHLADKGVQHWLKDGEEESLARVQALRCDLDPWHDLVSEYCLGKAEVQIPDALTVGVRLDPDKQHMGHSKRVAAIFRRLGYDRTRQTSVSGGSRTSRRSVRVYYKSGETP
jgi:predicted P-loop ATPase